MTRVVIIGNSHVGALKLAWDAIGAEYPWIEMEFFAAPGTTFRAFRLLDGLRFGAPPADHAAQGEHGITDMFGRTSIDLASTDHVLWAGYRWQQQLPGLLMQRYDIEGLREMGAPRLMSRHAFDAVAAAAAEQTAAAPEWRHWKQPKLVVLPQAMRSADLLNADGDNSAFPWKAVAEQPAGGREVVLAFLETMARTFRQMGIDLIHQPAATLLPVGLTEGHFGRGSRRLKSGDVHPDEDASHMNVDFGKLYLAEILERLAPAERTPTLIAMS